MNILRSGLIGLGVAAGVGLAAVPAVADGPYGKAYPWAWQGSYAGVHAGFGDAGSADGFVGGGQIGYNWQQGRVVYGVEADFSFSSIEEEVRFGPLHASASLDWLATVRGRVGYLIDPRILAYATAGLGIASWSAEAGISGCPECGIRLDGTESGFVIGLGAEMKINETMTGRIEYLTGSEDIGDFGIIRAGNNFKLGN
jgi:outer membrane immunogenic protein